MDQSQQFTSVTIRGIPVALKEKLRLRAAQHGHSMEAELRSILTHSMQAEVKQAPPPEIDLATAIHSLLAPLGGVDLPKIDYKQPDFTPASFE